VGISVITPIDVGRTNEEFEVVGTIVVAAVAAQQTPGFVSLELLDAFLSMGRKTEFLFVAPQDIGTLLQGRLCEDLVEIGDLVLSVIANQHQDRSFVPDDASLYERPHSFVEFFSDHLWRIELVGEWERG